MPFTLSHPAAVVPLKRVLPWTVLSALAIGSMTPDFPYFVGAGDFRWRTHGFASVIPFSMPVGAAVYFVFQRWLRAAWIDLLPAAFSARIPRRGTRASLAAILASVALGALTHVLWDSFTHEHQAGVNLVTPLNVVLFELLGFPVRGFNLLQHVSSAAGALALALGVWRWLARTPRGALPATWSRVAHARRSAPLLALGVVGPLATLAAAFSAPPSAQLADIRAFIGTAVVFAMSAALALLALYTVWWWAAPRASARVRDAVAE
jgi:phage shock protein PspC (stress-responsive transcriptional regulator)